ncbi:MAG: tetratricopeptide repeat protein [Actinomycetota bacterium]
MKTARIADQIAQVDLDLAEIDDQVEAGELDETTAERLRSAYRAERDALERELVEVPRDDAGAAEDKGSVVVGGPASKKPSRAIVGTVIVAVAAVVVAVVAMSSLEEKTPAGEMTDGVATDVLEGQGNVDMGSISLEEMEAVVAQNPDIVGMRIALAQRYLDEGILDKGLEHYTIALGQQPDDPILNAWVGWLTFLSGDPDTAEPHVVQALVLESDYPQAHWFLANIRFEQGDMDGVIEPLETLLGYEDLPPDIKADVEAMLEEARS